MSKKILIRMPNWLGDAVMATPAINNIIKEYPNAKLYMIASGAVCGIFKEDSRFEKLIVDESKKNKIRVLGIKEQAKIINEKYSSFDIIFVFTNSFSTTLLCSFVNSKIKVGAKSGARNLLLTDSIKIDKTAHQAVKYNQIVNGFLKKEYETGKTNIIINKKIKYKNKTIGIAPGAAYGGAKRWEAHKFAEVALKLSDKYDIVILGSENERDITKKIESVLEFNKVANYRNLAGKTTLLELVSHIAGCDLFICNDSGPMHIAGALEVPTVSIFGPTNFKQTYQWGNKKYKLIRHDIECAPCMKRECPLKHHKCMKNISADEVIKASLELL